MSDGNRAQILELAVAAIDAGGEAEIRVNHLVAQVGVTPPVLYYHFGNRDGLVIAAQIERVHIEHGTQKVDPTEWDRLTIEALERAFFG